MSRSGPRSVRPLEGRRALVTGAAGGLGGPISQALAAAGAAVTLAGRRQQPLDELAQRIVAAGGVASPAVLDVTDEGAVDEVFGALPTHDIVVNAAGTNRPQPFVDVEMSTFDELFDLNVRATFLVSRHVVRRLRNEELSGVICNISSQMGHVGAPNRAVYCASKHAVEGLTRALGVELAPHGIRVVAVAPTFVETPMTRPFLEDPRFRSEVLDSIPVGRLATAEEVATAVLYLVSPSAGMITGTSLVIDGGWTAR